MSDTLFVSVSESAAAPCIKRRFHKIVLFWLEYQMGGNRGTKPWLGLGVLNAHVRRLIVAKCTVGVARATVRVDLGG